MQLEISPFSCCRTSPPPPKSYLCTCTVHEATNDLYYKIDYFFK